MNYYEVYVGSGKYHGTTALTYAHESALAVGQLVIVPLGKLSASGFVANRVLKKPSFTVKHIAEVLAVTIPEELVALHAWLVDYYPGPLGLTTQLFIPSVATKGGPSAIAQTTDQIPLTPPPLTDTQRAAVEAITNSAQPTMLHGDTGSGKTRVYIELISRQLASGKSSIVLTPEIGLTTQLVSELEKYFPGQILLYHSNQTAASRRKTWMHIISSDKPQVIVGPRSALFAPVEKLGLIIIDESHDQSYKQDQTPHYQATHVAGMLAKLHAARLVLGSATPLVNDYFTFSQKKLPIIRMHGQAIASPSDTKTVVVDLKERGHFARSPWISNQLVDAISTALRNNRQALIYLNRRGTARLMLCGDCGWFAECPRCDLPLTYHGDTHILRCHTCGNTDKVPTVCPNCQSANTSLKSVGTKTLTHELAKLFPNARINRFDSDVEKEARLEAQYDKIKSGETDILIGTQLITKGLDLPNLSVVGVVNADTHIFFPDYSSEERTFQSLRQVIGRVGRGHTDGTVIVQTNFPDSNTILHAINNDYASFYDSQIHERSRFGFPPFYFVLKITAERSNRRGAETAITEVTKMLEEIPGITTSGPSPAFMEKINNKYRWQVVVKSPNRKRLTEVIKLLPKNTRFDIDPNNML